MTEAKQAILSFGFGKLGIAPRRGNPHRGPINRPLHITGIFLSSSKMFVGLRIFLSIFHMQCLMTIFDYL